MTRKTIELVYFKGCPNAQKARENLRSALESVGTRLDWEEWDLASETTPERYRRHGSPTVLVDGEDVTEDTGAVAAMACRADGAPSVSTISDRLR